MANENVIEVLPPEDEMTDFGRVVVLLMKSYEGGRGRTFDPKQVATLAEGLLDMSATVEAGVQHTIQLEQELEEERDKKAKLWRPKN